MSLTHSLDPHNYLSDDFEQLRQKSISALRLVFADDPSPKKRSTILNQAEQDSEIHRDELIVAFWSITASGELTSRADPMGLYYRLA